LQPVIREYRLPFELFDELIKGCEMDLETTRYETAADLELYCYRVASVVGLLSINIFGYQNPKSRDYAIALGQALQLTNILRDVHNDAARGRIYLPLAELRKFAVTEAEISARRILGPLRPPRRQRGRTRAELLSTRPPDFAPGRAPRHGRRRNDGLGLLAAAS
jgi:phytoene/squalene synthetase